MDRRDDRLRVIPHGQESVHIAAETFAIGNRIDTRAKLADLVEVVSRRESLALAADGDYRTTRVDQPLQRVGKLFEQFVG